VLTKEVARALGEVVYCFQCMMCASASTSLFDPWPCVSISTWESFWRALQQRLGTELRFTTAHTPNSNGKVEGNNTVRHRRIESGISEASKRVSIFSFDTQGGKQVSFYFRQGNWVQARDAQIRFPAG
jgi:hypothetical protein